MSLQEKGEVPVMNGLTGKTSVNSECVASH